MLPNTFFELLRANSVPLGRSEARVLLLQFQEPNGAVSATKFLRWIALNAPADHVNPDLFFPQLPQPYRRIMKVWDRDIFDAAWEIITTESVRFKAENAEVDAAMNSSRSALGAEKPPQQKNDYDIAKRRTCEPSWELPLDSSAQRVAGLAFHCVLPIVVAGLNCDADEDESTSTAPSLRVFSTAGEDVQVLGDIPTEFQAEPPAAATDTTTKVQVSIKSLSSLQLANDKSGLQSCAIAVHLLEKTTTTPVQQEESGGDVKPAVLTIRECVNVYTIRMDHSLDPNASSDDSRRFSSELLASLSPTQASVEPSIASIVLSPDSLILAVMSIGSKLISLYSLQREETNQDTEVAAHPLVLSSPSFQVDLEPTRSPFLEDELEPTLHFLVAPVTTRAQNRELPRSAPSTYAFARQFSTRPPDPIEVVGTPDQDYRFRAGYHDPIFGCGV
ncbi:hypothetical protein ON010_g12237 [Phytophthora cinnamomi]|nr:hypothetical protein ON010_g12237 [Phytophthora cinnamomi]